MTLKGIDVSGHNGWPFDARTETAYQESDFVIVKATQNTGFINHSCDPAVQRTLRDGKLFGFYHYAGGSDPAAEANFFHEQTKGYDRKGIPVVDWESYQNAAWGDTNWVRRFVDRYHELTGVWPMIYVQASAVTQIRNCTGDCALWIAGYPRATYDGWDPGRFPYDIGANVTLWQYTDANGVDRNIGYLDHDAWQRIANPGNNPAPAPAPAPAPKPAWEILTVDGIAGNATVRRWQQVMGTPVDGVITGQVRPDNRTYGRPSLTAVAYGPGGSALVRAVQRTVGTYADGLLGPDTIRAIQTRLGVKADAWFGRDTVRALQTRLNENRF